MDKAESIRRLTILRDFLKNNVKEDEFDLDKWECGTTKCAVGWACYIPEFNRLGLSITRNSNFSSPLYERIGTYSQGFKAAADFFGVTEHWAYYMFEISYYRNFNDPVTIETVCRHIDEVIKEKRNVQED